MIPKKFNEIGFPDFQRLVAEAIPEGRTLDYKRDLPGNNDSDKKEFLYDVTSFANASGGDLIFGLADKKDAEGKNTGTPEITGLAPNTNSDQEIQRLQSMLINGISPRLPPVQIRFYNNDAGVQVALVRVIKSWFPPHMVTFKGTQAFYSRNSAGKHSLDVTEIRNAFLGGEHLKQKIEDFRNQRLGRILADELPYKLISSVRVVSHFVPYASIEDRNNVNLANLGSLCPSFQKGYSRRYNLDGIVLISNTSNDSETMSYVQAYRDGKLEFVDCGTLSGIEERHFIPHHSLEKSIIATVNQAISFYKTQDISSPVVLMLSLLNVAGGKIAIDQWGRSTDSIQEQHLFLPDVVLEPQWESSIDQMLRPLFDLIWNACGYEKCGNFDSNGNWNPKN